MGKPDKKSSNSAEVISTAYSSDIAPVPLDRTPPSAFSTVLLPSTDDPAGFQQQVCKRLESILANSVALNDRLSMIDSRLSKLECSNLTESKSNLLSVQDSDQPPTLHSSDYTPLPSSDVSSKYRLSILESNVKDIRTKHQHDLDDLYGKHHHQKETINDIHIQFYNFKKDVKDYLGLDTPSRLNESESNVGDFDWDHVKHNMIDSPLRPSSPPLSNALLNPSTNLSDLSSADFFSTINYHFFSISILATSILCTWVTTPLRPPDPTFTKQGLFYFFLKIRGYVLLKI